jgi:transposase
MSISDLKHMPEPVRRIEVFTGAGRRRSWSSEEKAAIIAESCVEVETVCAVAHRHGLAPQQLSRRRRHLHHQRPSAKPHRRTPALGICPKASPQTWPEDDDAYITQTQFNVRF